jgi:hypothetical protein
MGPAPTSQVLAGHTTETGGQLRRTSRRAQHPKTRDARSRRSARKSFKNAREPTLAKPTARQALALPNCGLIGMLFKRDHAEGR